MKTRRQALTLAAVLAATVLTGGAAILGIAHGPSLAQASQPAVVQTVPSAPQHWEEGD